MKRKIYRTSVLTMFFGLLIFLRGYTQGTSTQKLEADQQKMKTLQQNMRDLQKQMSDLAQKHTQEILSKNAENLKALQFKNFDSLYSFARVDSIASFASKLADNVIVKIDGLSDSDFLVNGFDYAGGNLKKKGNQEKDLIEKTKSYSKSYSVSPKDKLIIDNQYGSVTVNTWNKKEFKVDVEIRVGTSDEAETQQLLESVNIISAQDQSNISFKTNIEKQNDKGIFMISRIKNNYNGNRNIAVNYTVFMPVKNALDITNRFGSVSLPDLEGAVTIHNSYGNFTAKELNNTSNDLRLKFGNADIEALNGGNLNFEYGKLKIGTASNLNATMGFSPVNIERLKSSANIKVQYGSGLKINNLDKTLKNLDIDASFTNVSLDLNGTENFLFDVTVKHNEFNYNNDRVKILDQPKTDSGRKFNFTKNYKGYVGKSGTDNKVTIKSNFQRVNFN